MYKLCTYANAHPLLPCERADNNICLVTGRTTQALSAMIQTTASDAVQGAMMETPARANAPTVLGDTLGASGMQGTSVLLKQAYEYEHHVRCSVALHPM